MQIYCNMLAMFNVRHVKITLYEKFEKNNINWYAEKERYSQYLRALAQYQVMALMIELKYYRNFLKNTSAYFDIIGVSESI